MMTEPIATRSKGQNAFLIFILGLLSTITPFSIDMYLPSFQAIANDLNTNVTRVSFSVSSYFLGYALGQILYGPFLDRYGRKRPLYLGLTIYLISTLVCAFAPTVEVLIGFRFIQALGGAAASVAATAMVRDFFPIKDGPKVFSLLMLILGVSPLLAPTVGSMMLMHFHWSAIFITLTAITFLILLVTAFFLPEGHTPDPSIRLQIAPVAKEFKAILSNQQFYTYTISSSFSFAGLFVYIAQSPAIFMNELHVSTRTYGLIFALLSVGVIGGSQVNLLLGKWFESRKVYKTALQMQIAVGFIFLVGASFRWYGLTGTIACLFAILACAGLTSPNATALSLAPFSKNLGSAASLQGFLRMGIGALLSAIAGLWPVPGSLPTAMVVMASTLIAYVILSSKRRS